MGRQNPDAPKRTFRLALFDNESSEPLRSVQFDKVQLAYGIATAVLALLIVAYCLFSFTPLRNTIPGYPDAHSRREAVANAIKVDSLENAMLRWGLYADHLSRVLTGEQKADYDSLVRIGTTRYLSDKSAAELARRDSVLRETVQKEDQFGVSSRAERDLPIEGMHFFAPIKGVVATGYDRALHPAIDISAPTGSVVSAVLDGTVVFSGWDAEAGYVIILHHRGDLLSIYTNNQKVLRSTGESVGAGTPIALVGGTTAKEGADHLHFELWQNGQSLDPTQFISF
jgi:murein DD-endopeptidase MepM/ murein hydrolase activator NlpD